MPDSTSISLASDMEAPLRSSGKKLKPLLSKDADSRLSLCPSDGCRKTIDSAGIMSSAEPLIVEHHTQALGTRLARDHMMALNMDIVSNPTWKEANLQRLSAETPPMIGHIPPRHDNQTIPQFRDLLRDLDAARNMESNA